MKLLVSLGAASLLALASLSASAQTRNIVHGRTAISLNANACKWASNVGATLSTIGHHDLKNCNATFRVEAGVVDLKSGQGEVQMTGGYLIASPTMKVKIENMILDTTNPTAPSVTALIVVNDTILGRLLLFTLQPPSTLSLPLQLQSGSVQIKGFVLTLASPAALAIDTAVGSAILQPGGIAGTADVTMFVNHEDDGDDD